jgi:SAM-dependent methyltransferase
MSAGQAPTYSGAARAFDQVAYSYDELFTNTAIGRAQRKQVWPSLLAAFPPGSRVLELNCGTGEDARFLAEQGRTVLACDGSAMMIRVARSREGRHGGRNLEFRQLANEELGQLSVATPFDGAFSNFAGLNCVLELRAVATDLAHRIRTNGRVLICLWSRWCVAEVIWYLAQGRPRKAVRRFSGAAAARVGGTTFSVAYPSVREIQGFFSPWFRLRSRRAVGLFVPPSYLEPHIRRHPRILGGLESLDRFCASWPALRDFGDHVLLEFVRCNL